MRFNIKTALLFLGLLALTNTEADAKVNRAARVGGRGHGGFGAGSGGSSNNRTLGGFSDSFALFFDGDEDGATGDPPEFCTLADSDAIECDDEDAHTACTLFIVTDCEGVSCDDFLAAKGDNTNIGYDQLIEGNATAFSFAVRAAIDGLTTFEQYGPFLQNRYMTICTSWQGSIATAADRLRGFASTCDNAFPPVCGNAAEAALVTSLGTIPATWTNDAGASAAYFLGGVTGGQFNLGGGVSEHAMWCAGQITATQMDDCILTSTNKWNDISPSAMAGRSSGGTPCDQIFTQPRVWVSVDPDTAFATPATLTNRFGSVSGAGDLTCTAMEAADRRRNGISTYFNLQSASLDGVDEQIARADSATIDADLDNNAIAFWMRATTLALMESLVMKNDSGQRSIGVRTDDADVNRLEMCVAINLADGSCADTCETTNDVLTNGTGAHVCAVYIGTEAAGSRVKFVVNGVDQAVTCGAGTVPAARPNGTSLIRFGAEGASRFFGPGLLDEIVWANGWTAANYLSNCSMLCCGASTCPSGCSYHAAANSLGLTGIVSYWPIDYDGHATATDRVGANNSGYTNMEELDIVFDTP